MKLAQVSMKNSMFDVILTWGSIGSGGVRNLAKVAGGFDDDRNPSKSYLW